VVLGAALAKSAAAHLAIGALAFRRSTAALVAATERFDSVLAVLHAIKRTQALPAPSIALKRSTPRAGRIAGGNDARTARERGYKPRPQEPHSLHQSAVTARRPSIGESPSCNRYGDESQGCCLNYGDAADEACSPDGAKRRSNPELHRRLDCFAEPVIGPATSGRSRWLAMTLSVPSP
jgi:hypothetical protein